MALRDTLERLNRSEPLIDPAILIAEWQKNVQSLFDAIERFLADLSSENLLSISRHDRRMTESRLGSYTIQFCEIKSGEEIVILSPVARIVAGARGRVDMYRRGRSKDAIRLLLTSAPEKPVIWSIGVSDQDRSVPPRYLELTKPRLELALDILLS